MMSRVVSHTEENALQLSLLELVGPNRTPEALMKAIRQRYPNLKKKEIVHAAFAAIIAIADNDFERALALQRFAIGQRGED
jgi:hypothetical protein